VKKIFKSWQGDILSRRKFLIKAGWGSLLAVLLGSFFYTLKFFSPRVLFETPSKFLVGKPGDYLTGNVDITYKDSHRICIVRSEDGRFYCLSVKCTHLGCTAAWKSSENIFHCPCHGSKFDQKGINFAGPAPRPLDRFNIDLTPQGNLIVDKSIVYKAKPGMNPDIVFPQSVLRV